MSRERAPSGAAGAVWEQWAGAVVGLVGGWKRVIARLGCAWGDEWARACGGAGRMQLPLARVGGRAAPPRPERMWGHSAAEKETTSGYSSATK